MDPETEPAPTPSPAPPKAGLIVFIAVLIAAAWVLLPGDAGRFDRAEFEFKRFYVDIYKPIFVPERLHGGAVLYRQRRNMGSVSDSFLMPKPPKTFRIFVVGGSVAQFFKIWPNGGSWGESLQKLDPSVRYEVINCGFSAYDSYRDALNVAEISHYQPDLIALFSGNNEFYRPPFVEHPALAYWMFRLQKTPPFSWFQRGQPALHYTRAERDRMFEENLRRMIRDGRRAGARVVVCALANNLGDYPPQGFCPFVHPELVRAMDALDRGAASEALARMSAYARAHPEDPVARFYVGRAREEGGDLAGAMEDYRAAADGDSDEMRCYPARNRLMRRIAAEEGAAVADLEKDFLQLDPREGLRLFYDGVHWFREYNPFVAALITQAAATLKGAPGDPRWDAGALERWRTVEARPKFSEEARLGYLYRMLVIAGQDSDVGRTSQRTLEFMAGLERYRPGTLAKLCDMKAGLFTWGDGNSQKREDLEAWWSRLLTMGGAQLRRMGLLNEAVSLLREAAKEAPQDPLPHLQLAIVEARLGRVDAMNRELALLPTQPGPPGRGGVSYDEIVPWAQCLQSGACVSKKAAPDSGG